MITVLGALVAGFLVGYLFSAYLVARDPDLVHLKSDEVIVKKPPSDLILVAVTQQVARRIVLQNSASKEKSVIEARDLV
jgi:hypothetical protein